MWRKNDKYQVCLPPFPLTQFGLLHIFLRHVSTKPHAEEGGYGASRGSLVLQLELWAKRVSDHWGRVEKNLPASRAENNPRKNARQYITV